MVGASGCSNLTIGFHWKAWSEDAASCEESYNDYGGIESTSVRQNFDTCYQGLGGLAGVKGKL